MMSCVILNVGAAVALMVWAHWCKCRARSNGYPQEMQGEALQEPDHQFHFLYQTSYSG